MTAPSSRRGFLRGLTTLPLIGGGVTLIGAPSAVAEPVTLSLLQEYETWLNCEASRLAVELRGPEKVYHQTQLYGAAFEFHGGSKYWLGEAATRPSTRAALVLSAVGCDWRGA